MSRDLSELAFQVALSQGFHLSLVTPQGPMRAACLATRLVELIDESGFELLDFVVLDPLIARPPGAPLHEGMLSAQLLDPLLNSATVLHSMRPMVVVDGLGTESQPDQPGAELAWRGFFQRMNERRNALIQRFRGVLIFALTEPLFAMLATSAPDTWSVRSGSYAASPKGEPRVCRFGGGALERQGQLRARLDRRDAERPPESVRADLRELAALLAEDGAWVAAEALLERERIELRSISAEPGGGQDAGATMESRSLPTLGAPEATSTEQSGGAPDRTLVELLMTLFSLDELRVVAWEVDPGLSKVLPSESVSASRFAREFYGMLVDRGLLDGRFFDLLVQRRPGKEQQIRAVQAALGISPTGMDLFYRGSVPIASVRLDRALRVSTLAKFATYMFDELLYALRIPRSELPSPQAPPVVRAEALLSWIEAVRGDEGLGQLDAALLQEYPGLARKARSFDGPT